MEDEMNARRIFTAAALGLALSAAACSGESPTVAQNDDEGQIVPGGAAPTDTAGFMPPPSS
ncbi:MAG TPA: hypothetical protein VF632_19150 [Longimicrobium sp.]|jgi:hypothetical protein